MKQETIIVGGTKGIGFEISRHLKKKGHKVITVSRNEVNSSKNHLKIDLNNFEFYKDNFQKKFKNSRIKNIIFSQRFRDNNLIDHLNVSLISTIKIIELLEKKLTKDSSIIIILSEARKKILNNHDLPYHIVHAGLESLIRFFAIKLGKKNIRINGISTTIIKKTSNKAFLSKSNKISKMLKDISALNKIGDSKNIAELVEFLCSKKADFITGQVISADGGINILASEAVAKKVLKINS